nr:hypothetical protein [Tanacetum cinerariifolium]
GGGCGDGVAEAGGGVVVWVAVAGVVVAEAACDDLVLTRPTFTAEYVTLAEKLHKLAIQLVADGSGLGSVEITYTSSRATHNFDTPLVRVMLVCVNEEQVIVDRSSDKPLEIVKVQIANVKSRLAGEIKVEGRVKDGVPNLMKVGVLDVDTSLEGNITNVA